MPLNLDPMRRFAEGEMIDHLLIRRDPDGYRDDPFDEHTGTHTPNPASTIWDGDGMIVPINASPNETAEGGGEASYMRNNIMVPLDSPEIKEGDEVTCVACVRDPTLNGKKFLIESVDRSSFAVFRMALVTERIVSGNR